jgi:hypothetical protein
LGNTGCSATSDFTDATSFLTQTNLKSKMIKVWLKAEILTAARSCISERKIHFVRGGYSQSVVHGYRVTL